MVNPIVLRPILGLLLMSVAEGPQPLPQCPGATAGDLVEAAVNAYTQDSTNHAAVIELLDCARSTYPDDLDVPYYRGKINFRHAKTLEVTLENDDKVRCITNEAAYQQLLTAAEEDWQQYLKLSLRVGGAPVEREEVEALRKQAVEKRGAAAALCPGGESASASASAPSPPEVREIERMIESLVAKTGLTRGEVMRGEARDFENRELIVLMEALREALVKAKLSSKFDLEPMYSQKIEMLARERSMLESELKFKRQMRALGGIFTSLGAATMVSAAVISVAPGVTVADTTDTAVSAQFGVIAMAGVLDLFSIVLIPWGARSVARSFTSTDDSLRDPIARDKYRLVQRKTRIVGVAGIGSCIVLAGIGASRFAKADSISSENLSESRYINQGFAFMATAAPMCAAGGVLMIKLTKLPNPQDAVLRLFPIVSPSRDIGLGLALNF